MKMNWKIFIGGFCIGAAVGLIGLSLIRTFIIIILLLIGIVILNQIKWGDRYDKR